MDFAPRYPVTMDIRNGQAPGPVILTVPHAGRDYPARFAPMVRLPIDRLKPLEDRHADALVRDAELAGFPVLIARTPRCWIDLNRAEDDIDPLLTPLPPGHRPGTGPKVRAGLGLIPRRLARGGDIWRAPVPLPDVMARIETVHRPWHAAIAALIDASVKAHGTAILVDVHSMPTLPGLKPAQIVVGDLFGRSAAPLYARLAQSEAEAAGYRAALNAPYAGGHVLERHGRPHHNVHALQIEVDRSLYLDRQLDRPAPAAAQVAGFIRALAESVRSAALRQPRALAAE